MTDNKAQTPPADVTPGAATQPPTEKQVLSEKAEEYLREGGKIEDYPATGQDAPTKGEPA